MTTTIKQLAAEHLIVDRAVQRDLNMTWVNQKLREGFDPDGLGALVVSHRENDTYHVCDGQHRLRLCIVSGHADMLLDCIVHEGLTRPQEATLFRLLNDRKSPQAIQRFLIAVIEGDPMVTALNDILTRNGWMARNARTDRSFSAISSLVSVYQGAHLSGVSDTNPDVCELTIQMLTAAWGHKADAVHRQLVMGLGLVLLRHRGVVDVHKIIDEMTGLGGGPRGLRSRAETLYSLRKGSVADCTADVLVEMHNKGKRAKALPPWRS